MPTINIKQMAKDTEQTESMVIQFFRDVMPDAKIDLKKGIVTYQFSDEVLKLIADELDGIHDDDDFVWFVSGKPATKTEKQRAIQQRNRNKKD